MKVGAEFVGEAFVFAVSGGIVVWEYNRSRESTAEKNAKIQKEARLQREALQAKLKTLDVRLQAIEEVMKSNSQFPLHFGKVYVPPSDTVPIEDEADALPVTADLEEATVTTKAEEGTEEKSSDSSKVPVMETTTASPKERSNLQTRLTKMQAEEQEKQSIWERFVWRPW
jgi:hypothetical protein